MDEGEEGEGWNCVYTWYILLDEPAAAAAGGGGGGDPVLMDECEEGEG